MITLTVDSTINTFTVRIKSQNNNPSFTVERSGSPVPVEEILKLPDVYEGKIENQNPGEYVLRIPTSGEVNSQGNSTFYIQYGFSLKKEMDLCQTYRQPFGCKRKLY